MPISVLLVTHRMIYLVAIVVSFVLCLMMYASDVTQGNICHIENGREPVAGASLFPTFPVVQVLCLGAAYGLNLWSPDRAILIGMIVFGVLFLVWVVSFSMLRAKYATITKAQHG